MKGIIYKYTSPSGKCYIGQTYRENKRKKEHINSAKSGSKCAFHKAIRKYGIDNFKYEILIEVESESIKELKEKLNNLEVYYINKFKSNKLENGYNLTDGGTTGANNTKRKVKQWSLDGKLIAIYDSISEIKEKLGIETSHIYSCCGSNDIYKTSYGFIWTYEEEDFKPFVRKSINKKKRPILQYSLDGNFIKEWDSYESVVRYLNCHHGSLNNVLIGKKKSLYGYVWIYKDAIKEVKYNRKKNNIPILQYSTDGSFIKEWESARQVYKDLGLFPGNICKALKDFSKSCGGYKWKYKNKKDENSL